MVSLAWWILSLFDVCEFSWLPVFIEGIIYVFICPFLIKNETSANSMQVFSIGFALFAFCKFFLGLSISSWWILASPTWFALAAFIPGGFTITNLLFSHLGLMSLPTWVLIVGILADVLFIIAIIVGIWESKK